MKSNMIFDSAHMILLNQVSKQFERNKIDDLIRQLLPTNLPQVAAHRKLIEDVLSNNFCEDVSLHKIDEVKIALAPLMKYKREKPSMMIELGLDDIIDSRKWIIVKKEGQKVMVEE